MIIIAHRGLISGPDKKLENTITQIDSAIKMGFNVEIDLWYVDKQYFLGHDEAQYKIDLDWLFKRENYLWVHCKNIDALLKMKKTSLNYFWHENDTVTLTSKGFIWAYPGKQPIKNSIAVLPEIHNDCVEDCFGVCTDYCLEYVERLRL
jgi:glycerophosphoryl diester phosphodiesterase